MFILFKTELPYSKKPRGEFATPEEAIAAIPGKIILAEEDNENPGCFDAMNAFGDIYAIEPKQEAK